MQEIPVGNTAADLLAALGTADPNHTFFDSFAFASGSTSEVECIKNGNAVCKFAYESGKAWFITPDGGRAGFYTGSVSDDYIDCIVATNKAIYLKNHNGGGAAIVIAKDTNGGIVFIFTFVPGTGITAISSEEQAANILTTLENGDVYARYYYLNNDDITHKSYFIPFLVNGDVFADGVYIATVRPYPTVSGYMPMTKGGTEYVGFNGTTFVVKA